MDEPLPEIPCFDLKNGYKIPATAFPTCRVDPQKHGNGEEDLLAKELKWAIEMGWRHFDCAQVDLNLKTVGKVINAAIHEGIVERSELFITSKIWNTHHSYQACQKAIDEILTDLQLDYLDLMLIHWPHGYAEGFESSEQGVFAEIAQFFPKKDGKMMYSKVDYLETWKALEEAVDDGKIRSIGVCNFNKSQLERLIDNSRIRPSVLQIELHPYLTQSELRQFCSKHDILVAGYSAPAIHVGSRFSTRLIEHPTIIAIKKPLKIHSASVILRWYYEHRIISVPFFQPIHNSLAYSKIFNFQLSADEVELIDKLDRGTKKWQANLNDVDHPLWPFERQPFRAVNRPGPSIPHFSTVQVPLLKLNSGYGMPMIGFATWRAFRKLIAEGWNTENSYRACTWAIDNGYRHFDCALVDMNQPSIGKAICEQINHGELRRNEFFVTSKVWNTFHSTEMCRLAVTKIMSQLKLSRSYIDLVLVHWPRGFAENHKAIIKDPSDLEYTELCELFPNDGHQFIHSDVDYLETWQALESAVDEASIRSIGVANFNQKQLERLWNAARIKPAVLQTHVSPYYPNEAIRKFCEQKGIVVAAHDPLGGDITKDPVIVKISRTLGKTPEQIVLRWLIEKGIAVLPKSYNINEFRSNLDIFQFTLSIEQIESIDELRVADEIENEEEPDWPFFDKIVTTKPIDIPTLPKKFQYPVVSLAFWGENGSKVVRTGEIDRALRLGFRSFDCSNSEFERDKINQALQNADGVTVKLSQCYVTAKIWPSYDSLDQCRDIMKQIGMQIKGRNTLYVLQWPRNNEVRLMPGGPSNIDYLTTWRQIEDASARGKFRYNGLCNFNIEQIRNILEMAMIPPSFLQLELNPYHQQKDLREFCRDNDILVVGYSPFGGGVLRDPVITEISRQVGKSPQQVILRWYQEHGVIALTQSFEYEDLLEIRDVFHFRLTSQQIESIDNLEKGVSCWNSNLLVESTEPNSRFTVSIPQQTMKLNSGYEMPMLALATWRAAPEYVGNCSEYTCVKTAVALGCRHVDTAFVDLNLRLVAKGFWETARFRYVKRDELFITSKIWNTCHSNEKCVEIINETLKALKLTYLDLMLIHWPQGYEESGRLFPGKYSSVDYLDTWRALEDAVKAGKIRSIGVANFNKKQIERVLENAEIRPSVVYIEMNPYLVQTEIRKFCRENDIAVIAYAPFGGNPDTVDTPDLWMDPVIVEIARQVQKTPLQVILRWFIEHQVAVSWKFFKPDEAKESMQIFDFKLSSEQVEKIDNLDKGLRTWNEKIHDEDHPYWPFHDKF